MSTALAETAAERPCAGCSRRQGAVDSIVESFNYAFEGDHPRAPHAAEHADPLRGRRRGAGRRARRSASTRLELIALLLAIAFVLIAEMINTAIEEAIDVATTSFDPLAKLAKDIAAGAVLIATVNAVAVGYLVFSGHVGRLDATASTGCATRRRS